MIVLLPREPITINTSFLSLAMSNFSLVVFFMFRAFSLHGLPVNIAFPLGKSLIVLSNDTPILSVYLAKNLLANPTTLFCSWMNVFLPNFLAAYITGAVT